MKPIRDYRNENGLRHKLDQPALVFPDGEQQWFVNGYIHREDGPAITKADGSKYWVIKNKYHRLDGPAVQMINGHKEWWIDGKRHNENGPAIEYCDGKKKWFLNDKECSFREEERIKMNEQLLHSTEFPSTSNDECDAWYVNGKLHRLDGPALIFKNGKKEWWVNGERHREDGPAVEYTANVFGTRNVHKDAHRSHYYLNNVFLTESEYNARLLNNTIKSFKEMANATSYFSKLEAVEKSILEQKEKKNKEFKELVDEGHKMAKQVHEETKGSRIFTREELQRRSA